MGQLSDPQPKVRDGCEWNPADASFWIRGTLVRYAGTWQHLAGDEWKDAIGEMSRTIADHLAVHCAADGYPSHEADRSLNHRTLVDAVRGTGTSWQRDARDALDALTGSERVEVLRHYGGSAKKAMAANAPRRGFVCRCEDGPCAGVLADGHCTNDDGCPA